MLDLETWGTTPYSTIISIGVCAFDPYADILKDGTVIADRFEVAIDPASRQGMRIDGETMLSVGEGNGPVNALDTALRKDLGPYQSYISDLELVDYKVRILTGGTDAVTRVLIESRDGEGNRWFTVGVSPNIVDASFEALLDSINYKLIRDGAVAP